MCHTRLVLLALSVATLALAASQSVDAQTANNPHKMAQVERHPFTVELKTTNVQTLANGTTITRESTEIRAEDSQHRTFSSRTHVLPWRDQPQTMIMVHIEDPVEGTQITWNSQKQEATVLRLPPLDQRHGCWQSDSAHMTMSYGPAQPVSAGGTAGTGLVGSLVVSTGGTSGSAGVSQSADISAVGIGGGVGSVGAVAAGVPHLAQTTPHVEDLGTTTIEGVEVHGHRFTHTIPAGQIGNDQPLFSTSESWSAPSLGGFALRSLRDDPQSGKSSTEVVRLDLSEPPLSTFQPPEGYKVVTEEMHQVPCKSPGQQ